MSEKVYVTIMTRGVGVRVGERYGLKKDLGNEHDDEAIMVVPLDDRGDSEERCECIMPIEDVMYVANSVRTVAMGTWSAGRLYDKLTDKSSVEIKFIIGNAAIGEVKL